MGIVGIVLAGGRSRRMDGRDKALVELGGQPLVARVLGRLRPQCIEVVLSANRDASAFRAFGVPVVADDILGFAGPLAGLIAGLDWIAAHYPDAEFAASSAVDTPFLPLDFVKRLQETLDRSGTACACAASGQRHHPVAALWPVAARHSMRQRLERDGERRLSTVIEALGCTQAEWSTEQLDPFLNINTPADLALGERLIASGGPD